MTRVKKATRVRRGKEGRMTSSDKLRPDALAGLRACKLWRTASDGSVEMLARTARVEDLPRGARLITEGEPALALGVVIAGRARIHHLGADGRKIVFEVVEGGEALGAVAALASGRYPASADAATPLTVAWLDRGEVFRLLEREPSVARDLIADLASRLVAFTRVATALSMDVPERLARFLFQRSLQVGKATPAGLLVELGMSKAELAASLGTVPETLSRAFGKLKRDGVIEVRAKSVVVLDVGALARLGEGYREG